MASGRSAPHTIAVILGGGRGQRLYPLTRQRCKPAVPLGGKYRLIDIPIANCLNSDINQIYVLTQFQSVSLHRHVTNTYRFDRFSDAFVEILAAQQSYEGNDWYQGTADAVRQNLNRFGNNWHEVLILSGDQLYHMDYRDLLAYHRTSAADITIAVLPVAREQTNSLGITKLSADGRVVGFIEKPAGDQLTGYETGAEVFQRFQIQAPGRPYAASMGIYVFNRKVLHDELKEHNYVDFGKHLFPTTIPKYRVQAFVFDGYWEDIGTVGAFHEANLGMARMPPTFSFKTPTGLVYTRPRMLPPTVAGRLQIVDSLVADGSQVGDAILEQSILGIRSIVGRNVRITRTLVMGADYYESDNDRSNNRRLGQPDVGIGDNVVIENAIVDKNVRIGSDVIIKNPERAQPTDSPIYAVRDGVICIHKGATVHSGTRIGV
jgi:glucose-1-phosphate adenylyltransferase